MKELASSELRSELQVEIYRCHRQLKGLKTIASVYRSNLAHASEADFELAPPLIWPDLLRPRQRNDHLDCATFGSKLQPAIGNYVHAFVTQR